MHALLATDLADTYRPSLGNCYPTKFPISSVLLAHTFGPVSGLEGAAHLNRMLGLALVSANGQQHGLKFWADQLPAFEISEDDPQRKAKLRLKLYYLTNFVQMWTGKDQTLLPVEYQAQVLDTVRKEHAEIDQGPGADMRWMLPRLRQTAATLLSKGEVFQAPGFKADLKFLIELEKEGLSVL